MHIDLYYNACMVQVQVSDFHDSLWYFIISGKNEQDVFGTIHKYHIDVFHGLH